MGRVRSAASADRGGDRQLTRFRLTDARRALAEEHFSFAMKVADVLYANYSWMRPHIDRDDVRGEAAIALSIAAAVYDPARGPFQPFYNRVLRNRLFRQVAATALVRWPEKRHAPLRRTNVELDEVCDAEQSWSDSVEVADEYTGVRKIMRSLSNVQREAVELYYGLDGIPRLTDGQIARKQHTTKATVRHRRFLAIRHLQRRMKHA